MTKIMSYKVVLFIMAALVFYVFSSNLYLKQCDRSVLAKIRDINTIVSKDVNPKLFDKFKRAHAGGYISSADEIKNFQFSQTLTDMRRGNLFYFFYDLHGKQHEVGVSECGEIETVSLVKDLEIIFK